MHFGSSFLLANSNYDPLRRTIFIVHGWAQSATSNVNAVLVPAFLQAEDVNVFVVDWSAGAGISAGNDAPQNAVASGLSVARTIDWIVFETGANIGGFHLVGFSLGAHQVAVAGRNVQSGQIPYITALDPGANMEDSGHIFGPDAAIYTEAIHTNSGLMGHGDVVAHTDFFPNGGDYQPGCGIVNFVCSHERYRKIHTAPRTYRSHTNKTQSFYAYSSTHGISCKYNKLNHQPIYYVPLLCMGLLSGEGLGHSATYAD
ncbi:endothelial lipase-like [Hyposmocoma kahamanoa]|uniref:endothelial lipase-like n=1 Tax=Hyposmocoma kahamanoa TaxID=1477025 RepID=UPI000E6D974C|nr:endothelial lipase-like [Hyposmocoma kahamanoa]